MSTETPAEELFTPRMIYEELDRFVIGQERAKKAVSVAAYNHSNRVFQRRRNKASLLKKTNILLIGPTGCGKTHIARNLARVLGLPFTVVDATEFTEAGYYGKDVEVMVAELLFKTEQDILQTQRGVIFIDEVDKIARRSHGARTGAGARDIGGEGVQQSLLKLLEGRKVFVPLNVTQHWNRHEFVSVDTTDILFICAGTFTDLHLYGSAGTIGFKTAQAGSPTQRITNKDLLEYGMLAELLGRLPVVVQMEELKPPELARVLSEPPDSVIREYAELLSTDEVKVEWEEEALRDVVGFSIHKRAGARGLRSIVDEVLRDLMFEAPERSGTTVVVTPEMVREKLEGFLLDHGGGGMEEAR